MQMKCGAMAAQPCPGGAQLAFAAKQLGAEAPEGDTVIHMLQMCHLMSHQIAGH